MIPLRRGSKNTQCLFLGFKYLSFSNDLNHSGRKMSKLETVSQFWWFVQTKSWWLCCIGWQVLLYFWVWTKNTKMTCLNSFFFRKTNITHTHIVASYELFQCFFVYFSHNNRWCYEWWSLHLGLMDIRRVLCLYINTKQRSETHLFVGYKKLCM